MTTTAPHADALVPALGARASVTEAFWGDPARFRLEFTNDLKTKELRWVLFTGTSCYLFIYDNHVPVYVLVQIAALVLHIKSSLWLCD